MYVDILILIVIIYFKLLLFIPIVERSRLLSESEAIDMNKVQINIWIVCENHY